MEVPHKQHPIPIPSLNAIRGQIGAYSVKSFMLIVVIKGIWHIFHAQLAQASWSCAHGCLLFTFQGLIEKGVVADNVQTSQRLQRDLKTTLLDTQTQLSEMISKHQKALLQVESAKKEAIEDVKKEHSELVQHNENLKKCNKDFEETAQQLRKTIQGLEKTERQLRKTMEQSTQELNSAIQNFKSSMKEKELMERADIIKERSPTSSEIAEKETPESNGSNTKWVRGY